MSRLLATAGLALIVTFFAIRDWFTPRISWHDIRNGLLFGLPIVPHLAAAWVNRSVDRLILERFVSLDELGLYNLGYMLGMAMMMIVLGINNAWIPYYYQLMKTAAKPERTIVQVVSGYITLIGGLCLIGILFVGEIVFLFLPTNFHGAIQYVGPVLAGYLFMGLYFFASAPLFFYSKTILLPWLTGAAALVNIVLNMLFIPNFGAIAAAWTTTSAYAVQMLIFFIVGQRYQQVTYPLLRYAAIIALIALAIPFSAALPVLTFFSFILKIWYLLIYLAVAYFLMTTIRAMC
jgi:O-antigen/teichoic acid export membrane protein